MVSFLASSLSSANVKKEPFPEFDRHVARAHRSPSIFSVAPPFNAGRRRIVILIRWRLFQASTPARHRQAVHRELLAVAVHLHLEPAGQQGLQDIRHLASRWCRPAVRR